MSHPDPNKSADDDVQPRWGGAALLWSGVLAFAGFIGATDTHAHHAVQVIMATTPLTVLDEQGAPHTGTKVVVPADAAHRIRGGAEDGTVVVLEPRIRARTSRTPACDRRRMGHQLGVRLRCAPTACHGGRRRSRAPITHYLRSRCPGATLLGRSCIAVAASSCSSRPSEGCRTRGTGGPFGEPLHSSVHRAGWNPASALRVVVTAEGCDHPGPRRGRSDWRRARCRLR